MSGRGLKNFTNTPIIGAMDNFSKGMNSIGQLLPQPYPYSDYPSMDSAWKCVADSLRQAGDSLRYAIKESPDAERERKQTP